MAKAKKRQKQKHTNHHDNPDRSKHVIRRQHSQVQNSRKATKRLAVSRTDGVKTGSQSKAPQQSSLKVPYQSSDRVLLIGEGDLSFAISLARHHHVASIVATTFDNDQVLEEKYPSIPSAIKMFKSLSHERRNTTKLDDGSRDDLASESSSAEQNTDIRRDAQDTTEARPKTLTTVFLSGIDATKLDKIHKKVLKPLAPFTKIVFNFPHVGGISTDVNRQVRANQELLVGFFHAAKAFLATPANPIQMMDKEPTSETYGTDEDVDDLDTEQDRSNWTSGHILVTLFEGEPYTLWNVRDLARHCGLKVVESYKFPWHAYPGYKHARTCGEITNGKDRSDEGKRKGAWRGEERNARCYVLALNEARSPYAAPGQGKKRRLPREFDDEDGA